MNCEKAMEWMDSRSPSSQKEGPNDEFGQHLASCDSCRSLWSAVSVVRSLPSEISLVADDQHFSQAIWTRVDTRQAAKQNAVRVLSLTIFAFAAVLVGVAAYLLPLGLWGSYIAQWGVQQWSQSLSDTSFLRHFLAQPHHYIPSVSPTAWEAVSPFTGVLWMIVAAAFVLNAGLYAANKRTHRNTQSR